MTCPREPNRLVLRDQVAVFAAASEAFSAANINCSIQESLDRFKPVLEKATEARLPVRGYVSCVLGCPYEGRVAPEDVVKVRNGTFLRNRIYTALCKLAPSFTEHATVIGFFSLSRLLIPRTHFRLRLFGCTRGR